MHPETINWLSERQVIITKGHCLLFSVNVCVGILKWRWKLSPYLFSSNCLETPWVYFHHKTKKYRSSLTLKWLRFTFSCDIMQEPDNDSLDRSQRRSITVRIGTASFDNHSLHLVFPSVKWRQRQFTLGIKHINFRNQLPCQLQQNQMTDSQEGDEMLLTAATASSEIKWSIKDNMQLWRDSGLI